jgi:hypothetical protein
MKTLRIFVSDALRNRVIGYCTIGSSVAVEIKNPNQRHLDWPSGGREPDEPRYGSLVAILPEMTATLTDEILDLHDRFIGGLFNKAKRKHDEAFQASGKAINEKVRLYAQIGQALLAAKRDGVDAFAAIEEILSWEDFTRSVSEAERLARPEDFDFLGLVTDGYSQLRRYAPTLLESFDFRAAPVVTPLMDAIETLRAVNRDNARTMPGSASTDFVSRRWHPYVFTEQGIDRRFYELCVLSELKNRLRLGDVWVVGSRQFKDFDTYLLDSKLFAKLRDQNRDLATRKSGLEVQLTSAIQHLNF